jgi:hypothetical protein
MVLAIKKAPGQDAFFYYKQFTINDRLPSQLRKRHLVF